MKLLWCFVVAVTLFKDFAEGSCLSYGHSCWGAHGKRSDPSINGQIHNNGYKGPINTQSLDGPHGSPRKSNRWTLVQIVPDKRNPNVIYATDDSNSEEASVPSPDYITGGGGSGGRRDSVKMRIFNRLSGKRLADENERMVRRKLISNEELNESQDDRNNELALSEEDRAASYINVMKQI